MEKKWKMLNFTSEKNCWIVWAPKAFVAVHQVLAVSREIWRSVPSHDVYFHVGNSSVPPRPSAVFVDTIFRIFPIVPCHAFCMWHWPIGKDLDLSFIWGHHHLHIVGLWISVDQLCTSQLATPCWRDPTRSKQQSTVAIWLSVWTLSCRCPMKLST